MKERGSLYLSNSFSFLFVLSFQSYVISSAEVNMIEKLLSALRHLTTNDLLKHIQEY